MVCFSPEVLCIADVLSVSPSSISDLKDTYLSPHWIIYTIKKDKKERVGGGGECNLRENFIFS